MFKTLTYLYFNRPIKYLMILICAIFLGLPIIGQMNSLPDNVVKLSIRNCYKDSIKEVESNDTYSLTCKKYVRDDNDG